MVSFSLYSFLFSFGNGSHQLLISSLSWHLTSSYLSSSFLDLLGLNLAQMVLIIIRVKFKIFLRFTHCVKELLFSGLHEILAPKSLSRGLYG